VCKGRVRIFCSAYQHIKERSSVAGEGIDADRGTLHRDPFTSSPVFLPAKELVRFPYYVTSSGPWQGTWGFSLTSRRIFLPVLLSREWSERKLILGDWPVR
jgi:hypothetical protein